MDYLNIKIKITTYLYVIQNSFYINVANRTKAAKYLLEAI